MRVVAGEQRLRGQAFGVVESLCLGDDKAARFEAIRWSSKATPGSGIIDAAGPVLKKGGGRVVPSRCKGCGQSRFSCHIATQPISGGCLSRALSDMTFKA